MLKVVMEITETKLIIDDSKQHILCICICVKKKYADRLVSSGASLVAQLVKSLPAMGETWFDPWVEKIPWRRKRQPPPVRLPGKFYGQRGFMGYNP